MPVGPFADKSKPPDDADVARALGPAAPLWNDLETRIAARFEPITREWAWAGRASGWSLRLKHRKRAVLYLTPADGFFRAAFALGEKAASAAHLAGLPAPVLATIDDAPRFVEGRAVRFEVREAATLPWIVRLAEIKMAT